MKRLAILLAFAAVALPQSALAWGNAGHRAVGEAAMRALPTEVPAFLRTPQAVRDVGELSREPDRLKGNRAYDQNHSPSHYVDVEPGGKILGGPTLDTLPPTRWEYEKALQAVGKDSWKAGYLPYSMLESYERLTRDFAYWRVLKAAEANPKWKAHRAWFVADRLRREALIFDSLGFLSHFVADGSQPLHTSVHANGWEEGYSNPQGYTTARIHGPFESDMVKKTLQPAAIARSMTPLRVCNCPMDQRIRDYLKASVALVEPLYQLEKAGGIADGDPRGPAFAHKQMAVGASELRDMIVESWRASEKQTVGWRPIPVADVLSGKTNPYPALYGID